MSGVLGLTRRQVAAGESQQARLVERVRQPRPFSEFVQAGGQVEPERTDTGSAQRGEVTTHTERGADVTCQRADVGAAGTVDLDVHVDEIPLAPDGQHVESVDANPARREFDGVSFAGQFVGPLAVDLDGADRRGNLVDLAAQHGYRLFDLRRPDPGGRHRLQHFAFGVLGRRGLAQPDGRGIRLVCRGQHAEDLGGPFDANDQYPRCHRVESACVTDLSGAEDPPAAADHVVTGHTRRLVHDDKAGFGHSTIAVSVKPSRTDQRPDSVCRGGPKGTEGSIRIRDSNPPEEPLPSTSKVM